MKIISILSLLAALVAQVTTNATQFWRDSITNYPTGCITTNTTLWYPHLPGSLTANDALVVSTTYTSGAAANGKKLRINGLNSEYIMRLFDQVNTNAFSSGTLYASFIANANFVPAGGAGTYFAAFNDLGSPPSAGNGFEFRGRVFEIGNSNTYPFTTTSPGTFRYGVANAAGDPAQGGGPSILYVPIDLIKNVDYQVVLKYVIDIGNPAEAATATLWVNPASESDTANRAGPTADPGAITTGLAGLLFRQRTGGGTVDIRDIVVGTSFTDVMTSTTPGPVLIATNFTTVSNYLGNPGLLEVFATSLGGGELSYQWYQIANGITNPVPGATSQKYVIDRLSGSDAGNYFCAITNSAGAGAASGANFAITVNTTLTPPTFTIQPKSAPAAIGSAVTLTTAVFGTGPLSYQWTFDGFPLTEGQPVAGDTSLVTGSQTPTLVVSGLTTNESGNFAVTVTTGSTAVSPTSVTSSNATVTVRPPQAVSIAFLRSLDDTSTWLPTDTASIYVITGIVTTATNVTSGNTSSYYVQDGTAGINLFVSGDTSFRPVRGDLVTASGTLTSFNNNLELQCVAGASAQSYSILSHGNIVPAPYVFWTGLTNNDALINTNLLGRFVMLTNIYFPAPGTAFTGNQNVIVTNQDGTPFTVFISAQCTNVVGQKMPAFAYSLLGPLVHFKSGAYSNAGYEVYLTTMDDLITNAPPAIDLLLTGTFSQGAALIWPAVPYSYSYSVIGSSNVAGPYVPIAPGLTFTNGAGVFNGLKRSGSQFFYQISSP